MYQPLTGTGNGSAPVVNITWPFLDKSHVVAAVNGIPVVATWTGASQITFTSAVPAGSTWSVSRQTPYDTAVVDFTNGSVLTEEDLDLAFEQLRFVFEEARQLGMGGDVALRQDLAAPGGADHVNFQGSTPGLSVSWGGARGGLAMMADPVTSPSADGWALLKLGILDGTEDGWLHNPALPDNVAIWTLVNSANGRSSIWGANFSAEVLAENDASAWGIEVDMNNNGSVVADPSAALKKVGVDAVNAGPEHSTAAYRASASHADSTGLWVNGYYADRIRDTGFWAGKVAGDTGTQFSIAAFRDSSDSRVGFLIDGGTHAYGIDLAAGIYTSAAIRLPNEGKIVGRNVEASADLEMMRLDTGDKLLLGSDVNGYGVRVAALGNYADDAAAAAAGVGIGQLYRNGSVLMVRVA
jgi:hypothetical protein